MVQYLTDRFWVMLPETDTVFLLMQAVHLVISMPSYRKYTVLV